MRKRIKQIISGALGIFILCGSIPEMMAEGGDEMQQLYEKGNFVNSYSTVAVGSKNNRSWRDGVISGNGEIGYVTSGEPYNDACFPAVLVSQK